MAHSPHQAARSLSQNNLQPPVSPGRAQKQQRRMTSPTSNNSLNLPEGYRPQGRPPSPLRNGFVPDTTTGIEHGEFSDDEDDEEHFIHEKYSDRSPSPSSSVSQLAASITQRVGNFLGNIAPRSPGAMLTDAELEAEAERERERSRREAERILTREAEQRKLVEERVLAMMENTRSLPPPPSLGQNTSNSPSPSSSPKESTNWWTSAKNRLTPTKEPLTPAQQVVQEAKAREKERKGKGKEKERERDNERPVTPQDAFTEPAIQNLNIPHPPPHRKPVPASPSSPTPSRPNSSNQPPNLTPSPMRTTDTASFSPSREASPLYAQFTSQGTLDVPGTLLAIAKRFEKLEKWTVGHVRALEDRMGDVERWLVDKEHEKEKEREESSMDASSRESSKSRSDEIPSSFRNDIQELKDGMAELQGRVSELGREMAVLATSPSNLSSGPSRQALLSVAPPTSSSAAVHDDISDVHTSPITTPPHSRLVSTARESTSPPMASSKTSGTRFPYPTGDYATPPDSGILPPRTFSPPQSPSSSLSSATRSRPLPVSGISGAGLGTPSRTVVPASSASSGLGVLSPQTHTTGRTLPAPKQSSPRHSSISPTPRKRYTVALGEPIVSPLDPQRRPSPRPLPSVAGIARLATSDSANDKDDDEDNDATIGKSASARFVAPTNGDYKSYSPSSAENSPSFSSNRRLRTQSAYGFSNIQGAPQTPVTPLRPRLRTRSTDRLNGPAPGPEQSFPTGKFVDPLVLRKQDREGTKSSVAPKPIGKVPVGQLVAFFDSERKDNV